MVTHDGESSVVTHQGDADKGDRDKQTVENATVTGIKHGIAAIKQAAAQLPP
jgi:hypothetical protein